MKPDKFAKRMTALAKMFEANVNDLVVKTALTVHSTVVLGTPVDTGRARGSWLVEIGKPAEGTADSPQDFGFGPAFDKARQKLRGYKPGGEVHLTNNLPYIKPLNEGHSKQAPIGFVEEAVAAGTKQVKGAKLLDSRTVGFGE